MTDLTKQWKKGELPEGWYYVIKTGDVEMLEYSCNCFLAVDVPLIDNEVTEVLAPVPTFEKWKAKLEENKRLKHDVGNLGYKIKNQRHEIDNRSKEIKKLKEFLKECELWFTGIVGNMNDKNVSEHNRKLPIGNFEHMFKVFSQKINEALK